MMSLSASMAYNMAAGVEAEIASGVSQHARACDRDDVIGVELVPAGGGCADHGGPVAVPDDGVDGRRADV